MWWIADRAMVMLSGAASKCFLDLLFTIGHFWLPQPPTIFWKFSSRKPTFDCHVWSLLIGTAGPHLLKSLELDTDFKKSHHHNFFLKLNSKRSWYHGHDHQSDWHFSSYLVFFTSSSSSLSIRIFNAPQFQVFSLFFFGWSWKKWNWMLKSLILVCTCTSVSYNVGPCPRISIKYQSSGVFPPVFNFSQIVSAPRSWIQLDLNVDHLAETRQGRCLCLKRQGAGRLVTHHIFAIDSIAVSVFVFVLVEFDKYWDGCGDPLRAAAESLKSLSSVKIGCNS